MPKYKGIIKRGNRYYYRIYRHGLQTEHGGYRTAYEASREHIAHLKRLDDQDLEPSNIILKDFIILYLTEYEMPGNRTSTAAMAEGICRNHIVPELGNMKLRDIKPFHLVQFKNHLLKYKSESVAYNTMRTLRKMLNLAVEWEYVVYSPLKTKLPPEPSTEHSVLTPRTGYSSLLTICRVETNILSHLPDCRLSDDRRYSASSGMISTSVKTP